MPEVHGADKGLIPHVKPEHQKPVTIPTACPIPPACHTRPTNQAQSIDQGLPTNVAPIPNPIQTISPYMPKPAPRTVQPLAEPEAQCQERTLPQPHLTAVSLPLVQATPASITQPSEPRVKHRPIPSYHEPFLRPPPRPPMQQMKKTTEKIYWIWTQTEISILRKIHLIRRALFHKHMRGLINHTFKSLWN